MLGDTASYATLDHIAATSFNQSLCTLVFTVRFVRLKNPFGCMYLTVNIIAFNRS